MLKKYHTMLKCHKVSRCSSPALHTRKIKAKPLDFCSHTILITTSPKSIFPGLAPRPPYLSWEFMPIAMGDVAERDVVTVLIFMWWIWTTSLSNPNIRKEHFWLSFQTLHLCLKKLKMHLARQVNRRLLCSFFYSIDKCMHWKIIHGWTDAFQLIGCRKVFWKLL